MRTISSIAETKTTIYFDLNIRTYAMNILALITARGGSKSIPQKNITLLAGKPLIAWTIESALRSSLHSVVVSTDDEEIAKIAKNWGAEVPFMRPAELARDDSPHILVIIHALQWLERYKNELYDYVLLLQPTSPFRSVADIDNVIQLALERNADSVVSVCPAETHPYLTKILAADGHLEDFTSKPGGYLRRQDLPPVHAINGAIYLVRRGVLLNKKTYYTENTFAYVMPPERSFDIDTPWDLYLADLIMKDRIKNERN